MIALIQYIRTIQFVQIMLEAGAILLLLLLSLFHEMVVTVLLSCNWQVFFVDVCDLNF